MPKNLQLLTARPGCVKISIMKILKRTLLTILAVIGFVVLLVALVLLSVVLFEPVIYGRFYEDAQREFALPGKSDGFVQQGFTYADDHFFTSGYMSNGEASRIYRTDADGQSTWVSLVGTGGKAYEGHAGGLSAYDDKMLLCDSEEGQMLVYSTKDILDAASGASVTATGTFAVHNNASFCHVEGDILYVGEFYKKGSYETDKAHHLTAPSGDKSYALVFAYDLTKTEGLPEFAYTLPDQAQGMCITNSKRIVISTSYSVSSSHHYIYKIGETTTQKFTVEGKEIPLWYLDSAALDEDIVNPPMSEELVYRNGRVYVMGESASNKYIFGKILRARDVWSYKLA